MEDLFFVVLALIVLAIPVLVIVLLAMVIGLRRRVLVAEGTLAQMALRLDAERVDPSSELKAGSGLGISEPSEDSEPERPTEDTKPTSAQELVAARAAAARIADVSSPPRAVVLRADRFAGLITWLQTNWFYVVSAVSLALAGVFLVQYGIEAGLLPPTARVLAALTLGAALIGGGEWIRRRWGDGEDSATAHLPSVFSGAGLVTLFGAVISARMLYGLIGAEVALVGLVAVAALALVLGWFHGPLLAAVGIIGAFAAPFLVGGSSEDASWLYGYFALIAALGLGIDTVRRWAWVSLLTLVLAFAAAQLVVLDDSGTRWAHMLFLTLLSGMAVLIPSRSLWPDHSGAMVAEIVRTRGAPWPEFPTRLAFGTVALASLLIATSAYGDTEFWLAIICLTVLSGALMVWSTTGRALQDVALLPALGLISAVVLHGADNGAVLRAFEAAYDVSVEEDYPWAITMLVMFGLAITALAAWRSVQDSEYGLIWGGVAAVFAPGLAVLLDVFWQPADTIGAYPWALHAAVLAAVATGLAGLYARVDGPGQRLRASIAALAAMSAMSFALILVLNAAALTLALALTVTAAVWFDRRFNLPAMGAFVSAGVVTVGYRLIADPGVLRLQNGPLSDMVLSYFGSAAAFGAALWLLRGIRRPTSRVMLETGFASALGVGLSQGLIRWLEETVRVSESGHWAFGLTAVIWLILMFVQLIRSELTGRLLRLVRFGLAVVFGLIGFGAIALAVTIANPLFQDAMGDIVGPPVINTLLIAYLLPALLLFVGARGLPDGLRLLSRGFQIVAGLLAALWLFSVIRHFWQGPMQMELDRGMGQPELYTYTVVLLLAGAGLFYQSLAGGRELLRRAGLIVIGLAVAKVFLIDISGLGGLTRVFALLVLGLSLAGLAWLDRWAQTRSKAQPD